MNQLSLLFVVVLTVHLVVAPKGVNGNLFDFLFGSSSTPSPSTNSPTTPSCGPRFRKPWLLYTPDEKAAYLEAISLAMKNRHYIQFVELHIDRLSEAEAHGNGAFLYWHRLMLLGFENMLRSYGPKYACITVPYWDYISESANVGACQTVGNCSMLAQDTGGAQFGFGSDFSPYGFNILGQTISGYKCVNQSILKNFCGDKTPVAQCGCLPRGDWFSAIHPASANYASIYRQLFPDPSSTSFNILTFTSSLEKGVHDEMHSILQGAMSTFKAPADPIFFSHHATLDMLHTIHIKCRVGTDLLSTIDRTNNPYYWRSSTSKLGKSIFPDTYITMRVQGTNGPVQVHDNLPGNSLYPFFKDLPRTYKDLTDVRDIGEFSYNYVLQDNLANLYKNCANAPKTPSAFLAFSFETSGKSEATKTTTSSSNNKKTDDDRNADPKKSRTRKSMKPILRPATSKCHRQQRWIEVAHDSAYSESYNESLAAEQMELMMCKYYDDCLHGVKDYTAAFRRSFNVTGSPRCYLLLKQLKANKKQIVVKNWKNLIEQFFECPKQQKEKDSSSNYSSYSTSQGTLTRIENTIPKGIKPIQPIKSNPASTPTQKPLSTSADPCGFRIRKSWSALSRGQKKLYLEALELAMTKRYYIQFVQLYSDGFSKEEAFETGTSMYWHRRFLLGFENMLRSLGTRFQCVTVPYWDYVSESARYMLHKCDSIESCSTLAQDTGGSESGLNQTLMILGKEISGHKCVNNGILKSFCGDRNFRSKAFCGCLPRGDWQSSPHPSAANYALIYSQLFPMGSSAADYSIRNFTHNIQKGVQSEIMSLLNSTMSTLQAAADPIYYSHLATIDLLHTIHLKCRVGEDLLKGIHRAKNRFLWQNAVTRSGRPLFADSAITMRVQAFHGAKQVHRNVPGNTLYPFFKDLPILYGGYTDVRDIGKFSYNYAHEGLLTILYLNCEAASSMMRVPSLLLEDKEDSDMESGVIPHKELFEADEVDIATKRRRYGNHEESGSKYPRPLLKKIGRTSNRLRMWTIAAHEAGFFKTFDPVKADEQIELMLCKFYDECLGGTPDYSPKFRKNYGIKGPPRCYRLMKDLEEGRKKILVENWQGLMSKILKTTCKVGFSSQE